jgi:hypothetical protein
MVSEALLALTNACPSCVPSFQQTCHEIVEKNRLQELRTLSLNTEVQLKRTSGFLSSKEIRDTQMKKQKEGARATSISPKID